MELKGDKNIVANAGGVANQITNINIDSMNEEQFKAISDQLNQVMGAVGIKDETGQEPAGVTPEQQVISEAVRQKVDEADASFTELAGMPETYLKLGNLEYESENFEKAVEYYDKIIAIDPQDDNAWYAKGVALYFLGKNREATDCYCQTLEINPQKDDAWFAMGSLLYSVKSYDKSIKCYDMALELNSKLAGAWAGKGLAFIELKKYGEAIHCFDKVIEFDPDSPIKEFRDQWMK